MSEELYQIKITQIELAAKSVKPPTEHTPPEQLTFNFSVDIKIPLDKKAAVVVTDVSLLNPKDEVELASFKLAMVFEVVDFDKLIEIVQEKLYMIPPSLEIILKSVGLSTMRGVIYSELRGTYLHGAVLPLIDVGSLILSSKKANPETVANK